MANDINDIKANDRQNTVDALKELNLNNLGDYAVSNQLMKHVSYDTCAQLVLKCKGGYLVAYPSGDPGIFDEINVVFVADDGRLLQLAIVGRDEEKGDWRSDEVPDYQPMHVYAFDGVDEEVQSIQYVTVNDNSYWYNV